MSLSSTGISNFVIDYEMEIIENKTKAIWLRFVLLFATDCKLITEHDGSGRVM